MKVGSMRDIRDDLRERLAIVRDRHSAEIVQYELKSALLTKKHKQILGELERELRAVEHMLALEDQRYASTVHSERVADVHPIRKLRM